ncbi:MAG: OmpH family outer membrane protein [Legionellales bacterium]|nr:OmpH family outer membrane protein [Legionellales bacterium]
MKRLSMCLAAALALVSVAVSAADSMIGVVDLQKIMQTSSQMKAIQDKLEKEFKERRDKLVATEATLKKDMEDFKRDTAVLSPSHRKDLEKKIVSEQQEFERNGQQYQQELSTAHNEEMEKFYNRIRKAIAKVAEDEKFDVVFQKDAAPFSVDKLDITAKVMQEIK